MMNYLATDEFPYQIVAFVGNKPELGDQAYSGSRGWRPQVGIKRRFGLMSLSEAQLLGRLTAFLATVEPFTIELGDVNRGVLPVEVIDVTNQAPKLCHYALLDCLGRKIRSRFPDREGDGYYPHMTIQWNGRQVVDAGAFTGSKHAVHDLWLLKDDVDADDSRVFARFRLGAFSRNAKSPTSAGD